MARYLQKLLNAKEPLFSAGLKKLEQATGNRGVDVRLIGDIQTKAHVIMRQLRLDPADTTTKELYGALHGTLPKSVLKDSQYVGYISKDSVISFNANDVKRNKNRVFVERTLDALRQNLAAELHRRYVAANPQVEARITELLTDAGIKTLKLDDKKKGKE